MSVVAFVIVVVFTFGGERLQDIPAGVDGSVVAVVNRVEQVLFDFVGLHCVVLVEQSAHGLVALAHGVDVLDGDFQRHCVINHVCHIEVVVAPGNFEQSVGLVSIVVAVFHIYPVAGVDGENQVVEATVAQQSHCSFELKFERI